MPPAENRKKPEQAGELEASKRKKKKTTRIPLPIKPEPEKLVSEKPEKPVEVGLFEKKEKQTEEGAESIPFSKEAAEKITAEEEAKENPTVQEAVEAAVAEEFASDAPVIISRGTEAIESLTSREVEHSETETIPALVLPEISVEAKVQETPAVKVEGPPEAAPVAVQEAVIVPELRTEIAEEKLVTSEVADADLHPQEPAPEYAPPLVAEVSLRNSMIDPSRHETERAYEPATPVARLESNQPSYSNEDLKRAEKRGLRRGVVSGAFAAWWLGRRKRRTLERDAEVALRQRDRKITQLESEQAASQPHETVQPTSAAKVTIDLRATAEDQRSIQSPETKLAKEHADLHVAIAIEKAKGEAIQKKITPELPPEERLVTEETYQAPDGRRVETSVWHRYEVDTKTGKLAEEPTIEYGEEFSRELRQEKLQREAVEPQVAVQLGQAVLHDDVLNTAQASLPASEPASKPEKASLREALAKHPVSKQLVRQTTRPLTWVLALVIVVLLFLVGILR